MEGSDVTTAVIDAHAHVWTQDRVRYPFGPLDGLPPPHDVRTPNEFDTDSADESVAGVLLIQPRIYGYDHSYVYQAAAAMSGRARVMPLIDASRPDAPAILHRHARSAMTAGFRVIALGPLSTEWLDSQGAQWLWKAGAELNLPAGFLVEPNQLPLVRQIADAHPQLNVVIDHLARCHGQQLAAWTTALCTLIELPNVYVKISAIGTLSRNAFPHRDMWPLVDALYCAAGARKLLWGSDWPHNMVTGSYGSSRAAVAQALAGAPDADHDAIFRCTAAHLFGFDVNTTTAGVARGDT
jgi:L-fuconolactonase